MASAGYQSTGSGSDSDDNTARRGCDENRQRLTLFVSVVALVVAVFQGWLPKREPRNDCSAFIDGLAKHIEQKYVFEFHDGTLIQRKDVNTSLMDTFDRTKLMVVLGQRQAGKSVLVQSWLNGKKNVYHYNPKDGDKLGEDLTNACGREFVSHGMLIRALRKVKKMAEEPAIVVFEIAHNTESQAITSIYESLKVIVFDSQLPHTKGILVLSNSYATDAFPADRGRYETVWVGDLTESEAKEFIRSKRRKSDVGDYIEGLNATGLHIRQLQSALQKPSLEAWKQNVKREVKLSVQKPTTVELMQKLPLSTAGVEFEELGNDGAKLIQQAREDTYRVVVYNAVSGRFHWASPQHHVAWTEVKDKLHGMDEL